MKDMNTINLMLLLSVKLYIFEFTKLFSMDSKLIAFGRLLTIMDQLREKCPWDKKQTIESLRYLTIET